MKRNRRLYARLREIDADLSARLDTICSEALKIWEEPQFKMYTGHGREHIEQVEANLDNLTRPLQESDQDLTAVEIFVLIAACYLHDIGMQLDRPDAREQHAQYAYDLILHAGRDSPDKAYGIRLSLPDNNALEAIAEVAKGHWTCFALKLAREQLIYGNQKGRLRLLGILLATADLLDLSPERARYFRQSHRLYTLNPISELHQKMHNIVRGFDIKAPDANIPGDLQFHLEWRGDSHDVKIMSDWVLHTLSAQWRQLHPCLRTDSGGSIRWVKPWARASFRPLAGTTEQLSFQARNVLLAERAEQLRIGRDGFVNAFDAALAKKQTTVFRLPRNAEGDSSKVSQWSEYRARSCANTRVARVNLEAHRASDAHSLIAILMSQWGEGLGDIKEGTDPFQYIENFLIQEDSRRFVTFIVGDEPEPRSLERLVSALLTTPQNSEPCGRVVILTLPATGTSKLRFNEETFASSDISQDDIQRHLMDSWGYSKEVSRELATEACRSRYHQRPGMLYTFIYDRCLCWEHNVHF